MTAIAVQYKPQILERVARGQRFNDIIAELNLGVSHQALSKVLHTDPEFKEARVVGLGTILDKRESEMECAVDQVAVARARELLAQARWRAEREAPGIWGARTQIDVSVDIGTELQQLCRTLSQTVVTDRGNSEPVTIEHDDNQ
jgi:hypothetical protein